MVRGVISILPRATSRIAATTSAAARDLWRNALAPDCTAANLAPSVSSRVRKIILAAGRMLRIADAASGPDPSGRRKSSRTTSGLSSAAAGRHSATLPTLPDHLHVGLAVDQRGEALRDDAVVFDDQDASRLGVTIASGSLGWRGVFFGGRHIPKTVQYG
jgi:hypothetical protein